MIDSPHPELRRNDSPWLVTAVSCLIVAVAGCRHLPAVVVPPPVAAPIIVRVEAPVPNYFPIPSSLPDYVSPPVPGALEREQADRAFTTGSYDEAIHAYEKFLLISPTGEWRDEALFRLALCYLLRNNGNSDWQRAKPTLQQLISDYPDSALKGPAALILTLRSQVDELAGNIKAREQSMRQLSTELERLKRIDADRGRSF